MAEKAEAVKGLYPKLLAVMGGVERIPKNGRNKSQNYDYVLEADLSAHIRKLLIDNRLFVTSTVVDSVRTGEISSVKMAFTVIDVDNPKDSLSVEFVGDGWDRGDKGAFKAMTGATKYFLLKTFLIPTGDDPEDDPADQQKPPSSPPLETKKPEQKKQEDPKPFVALAISHLAAIDKCETIAALKSFWLKHEAEVREMPKELSDKVTAAKEAKKKALTPADSK